MGRFQVSGPIAVVLLFSLAGCTSSGGSAGETPSAGVTAVGASSAFSDETGAVEGVVVDDSLQPIEGADVSLEPFGLLTTTTGDGSFGFSFVPPGQVTITASRPDFAGDVASLAVEAGQTNSVQLILASIPGVTPYTTLLVQAGLIECSVILLMIPLELQSHCNPNAQETNFHYVDVPSTFSGAVLETVWESSQEGMGLAAYCMECNGTQIIDLKQASQPAIRIAFTPGSQKQSVNPSNPDRYVVVPLTNFTLAVYGFYNGFVPDAYVPILNPACQQFGYDECFGIGVSPSYRYQGYYTFFHNDATVDLESYSAVPDN